MTLRDYFAAKAMAAILAKAPLRGNGAGADEAGIKHSTEAGLNNMRLAAASGAYRIADAMLAERSK